MLDQSWVKRRSLYDVDYNINTNFNTDFNSNSEELKHQSIFHDFNQSKEQEYDKSENNRKNDQKNLHEKKVNDFLNSYHFNSEFISNSSFNSDITLIELSIFLNSEQIYHYLNDKLQHSKIRIPPHFYEYLSLSEDETIFDYFFNLPKTYQQEHQQEQILIQPIFTTENIHKIIETSISHHLYKFYLYLEEYFKEYFQSQQIEQIEQEPLEYFENPYQIYESFCQDSYVDISLRRSYFDFLPHFFKLGLNHQILIGLFCLTNNFLGFEYIETFNNLDYNYLYQSISPLEYCIRKSNSTIFEYLIEKPNINLNLIIEGENLLQFSCRQGNSKIVSSILKLQLFDINEKTVDEGLFPLHLACLSGDSLTVQQILREKKVKINVRVKSGDFKGRTPLHFACESGNPDVVSLLLNTREELQLDLLDCKGKTPLVIASLNNHSRCIELLLQMNDIDINQEFHGNNILQLACIENKTEAFSILLHEIVFDVNELTSQKKSLLHIAIANQNIQIVHDILNASSQVDVNLLNSEGKTPLIVACELGLYEIVVLFLEHDKIDINKKGNDGNTPFLVTAKLGNLKQLKLLYAYGDTEIFETNNDGQNALHLSCYSGNIPTIQFLLKYFKDKINEPSLSGEIPLHIACKSGNSDVIRILIKMKGIHVDNPDNQGKTPLFSACESGNFEIMKVLLENKNINIYERAKDGKNLFLMACESNNFQIAKFLMEETDIDVNLKSYDGKNALSYLLKNNNMKLIDLLIESQKIDVNEIVNKKTFASKIIKHNQITILERLLLKKNMNFNIPSPKYNNQTSFQISCGLNSLEIFSKLKDRDDVDINASTSENDHPLIILIQKHPFKFQKNENDNVQQQIHIRGLNFLTSNYPSLVSENIYWKDFFDKNELNVNAIGENGDSALHISIQRNYNDIMNALLTKPNLDINIINKEMQTPLHLAINRNNKTIVAQLLNIPGIDVNIIDKKGKTPLLMALSNNSHEIVQELLEQQDIILTNSDEKGKTPLHMIVKDSNLCLLYFNKFIENDKIDFMAKTKKGKTVFYYLAKKCTDIQYLQKIMDKNPSLLNIPSNKGITPLFRAIKNGNSIATSFLLEQDNINIRNHQGEASLLHLACHSNHSEIIKKLYPLTIDEINVVNESGYTPLLLACSRCNTNVIEAILDIPGVNVSIESPNDSKTALHYISSMEKSQLLEKLLSINGLDINKQTSLSETALHISVLHKNVRNIDLLLANPMINPYFYNSFNKTPLIIAVETNNTKIVQKLVNCDATDLNAPQLNNNETPLFKACNLWYSEIASILLEDPRINPNIPNLPQLQTPLIVSVNMWRLNLIKMLLNTSNIDVNCCDSEGYSALHYACKIHCIDIAKSLLNRGANANIQGRNGKTPLHVSCESFNSDIIIFMLDYSDPSFTDSQGRTAFDIYLSNPSGVSDLVYNKFNKIAELNKTHVNCNIYEICEEGNYENIEFILSNLSVEINNSNNEDQMTLLHLLCRNQNEKLIEKVLEHKDLNINQKDAHGRTALHHTVFTNNNPNVINILLKNDKININEVDCEGRTPLHYACKLGKSEICCQLLSQNDRINVNCIDKNGQTPLHLLTSFRSFSSQILEAILDHKNINLNKKDKINGNTPIHLACRNEITNFVKIVYEKALNVIDINALNDKNKTAFYYSCVKCDLITIDIMLQFPSIDVNLSNPIVAAAKYHHFSLVDNLLNLPNIDLSSMNNMDMNLLHISCRYGNKYIVQKLIDANQFDINEPTKNEQETPLLLALKAKNLENVNLILQTYEDIDVNTADKKGKSPIHYCCEFSQDANILRDLINRNADINLRTSNKMGKTPLIIAFEAQNWDAVVLLLQLNEIDISCYSNSTGNSILHYSMNFRRKDLVDFILIKLKNNHDIDFNTLFVNKQNLSGETALLIACKNDFLYGVNSLFDLIGDRLDVNKKDKTGKSPLYVAAKNGFNNIVESLLTRSSNLIVNKQLNESDNCYPIHVIIDNCNNTCAKLLLERSDIDINVRQSNSDTPLSLVVKIGKEDILESLLKFGNLDTSIQIDGKSLFLHAVMGGSVKIIEKLLDIGGFDLNQKFNGKTALHYAVEKHKTDVVQLLIENPNVDVNCVANKGHFTPLHIATKKNYVDIVEILLNLDKNIDLNLLSTGKKKPEETRNNKKIMALFNAYRERNGT